MAALKAILISIILCSKVAIADVNFTDDFSSETKDEVENKIIEWDEKRDEEDAEQKRRIEEFRKKNPFFCATIDSKCIGFLCRTSHLQISRNYSTFSKLYDSSPDGTLCPFNNTLAGTYHWSVLIDDKLICSGTFIHSGRNKSLSLHVSSTCSDSFYYEY